MDVLSYALSKKYTDEQIAEQKLKVAKVEKDINDYKQVMSQVNINQEAKQNVSGYEVISLPKNAANGQVSGIEMRGLTLINNRTNTTEEKDFLNMPSGQNLRTNDFTNLKIIEGHKYFIFYAFSSGSDVANINILRYYNGTIIPDNTILTLENNLNNDGLNVYGTFISPNTDEVDIYPRNNVNGSNYYYKYFILIDQTALGIEDFTEEQMAQLCRLGDFSGTKSTISAFRIRSVSEDESQESVVYVLAKDDEGNIEELRSLPNGVKDEFNITQGKLIKRISNERVLTGNDKWKYWDEYDTIYRFRLRGEFADAVQLTQGSAVGWSSAKTWIAMQWSINFDESLNFGSSDLRLGILKTKIDSLSGDTVLDKFKNYMNANPITLIYQLAEPIIMPIQVSGNLITYPSGTIYIEPVVADAGIYEANGIGVLHQELPINYIEKISKIDFETGLETELNTSQAIISEDGTYFTHPELVEGDIVFFEYYYPSDMTTQGETEVEYYDSRYVIQDSVTGKFYKWKIAVADGTPTIELEEV